MPTLLNIIPGSLPVGYCWPDPQTYLNDISAISGVQIDVTGAKYVISQNTTPAATQRTFLWHNPDTGHLLAWNAGVTRWEQPHNYAPGSEVRLLWVGTPAQLLSFDGGDGGSNPMWEVDTLLAGRVPVAVGNLPGSGTAVALGDTGGSDQVTIAQANLPAVTVAVKTSVVGQSGVGTDVPVVGNTYGSDPIAGSGRAVDGTISDLAGRYHTRGQTDPLGSGTAMTVVPGYYGLYIVKRSARTSYWS